MSLSLKMNQSKSFQWKSILEMAWDKKVILGTRYSQKIILGVRRLHSSRGFDLRIKENLTWLSNLQHLSFQVLAPERGIVCRVPRLPEGSVGGVEQLQTGRTAREEVKKTTSIVGKYSFCQFGASHSIAEKHLCPAGVHSLKKTTKTFFFFI